MPVAVEGRIIEKIQEILDEQRLDTTELPLIAAMVRKYRAQRKTLPHSLHLSVIDARGANLHMRVLVWRSQQWRIDRLACITNHGRLYASTKRTDRSFRVPRMVRHGEHLLLWDLTEHVDARNLPWSFHGPPRLQEHLRQVDAFFRIATELERVRLRDVPERDWDRFGEDISAWTRWAQRTGIISPALLSRIDEVAESYSPSRSQTVLTHGDFNPSNIMFPLRGKPWLIDFDHLRRSVKGDNIARLLTVSYIEPLWCERVLGRALRVYGNERDRVGFVLAATWHTLNGWQREFREYSPVRRVHSLDQLDALVPRSKLHITKQRKLLVRILDDFGC